MNHKVNKRARLSAKRLVPKLLRAVLSGPTDPEYNGACDASRAWLFSHDNVHFRKSYTKLVHPPIPELLQRRLDRIIYLTQGGYTDDKSVNDRSRAD